jgi:hypothetical protein
MTAMKRCICGALFAAGLAAGLGLAAAQVNPGEPDPSTWLKQVYALYEKAQSTPALDGKATTDLIEKRASKTLAALFRKDAACSKRTQGVCALDFDFVVDGQDYKISKVDVGPTVATGDKATVTVTFRNFDADSRNVYSFVREGGQWKVDDVLFKSGSDEPASLAKLISDYK